MFFERKNLRIFIYSAAIDMRCGFEKLHYYTKVVMQQEINQGHLYLFFGKNRRRIKVLFFDGTGLVQISKRLERGRFMSKLELGEISEITFSEFKSVFNGGLVVRPKVERSLFVNKSMTQAGHSLHAGYNQSNLNHAQY